MKKPELGDTVVIKGVVDSVNREGTLFTLKVPNCVSLLFNLCHISEIIPAPYVPKIGHNVIYGNDLVVRQVLAVSGDYVWISQKGCGPITVGKNFLKRAPESAE